MTFPTMKKATEAYQKGRKAARQGKSLNSCRYRNSDLRAWWRTGWKDQKGDSQKRRHGARLIPRGDK